MHRRFGSPTSLSPARHPYISGTAALSGSGYVRYSSHARSRAARRNLEPADVEYVLAFGTPIQRTGCTIYFLARRDIPRSDRHNSSITRLEGTAVLVAKQGEVITVYRNRDAYRTLCRKAKYRLTEQQLAPVIAAADLLEDEDLFDGDEDVLADDMPEGVGAA